MLTREVKGLKPLEGSKERGVFEWQSIREQLRSPLVLPSPINLHLIRHAQSTVNADKRITGAQDVKLTSSGEAQAAYLGEKLSKHYDLAFSSTLQRSRKTLELAVKYGEITVGKTFIDDRLNERSLGILEGQKSQQIPEYASGDLYYAPKSGENYDRVARRVISFLIDLANYSLENQIKNVLISGHMGPMRIMVGILKEEKDPATVLGLRFSNTEIIKLLWSNLVIPEFLRDVSKNLNCQVIKPEASGV